MKKEDLYRAMNTIDDDLLEEAERTPAVRRAGHRNAWAGLTVLAAALVLAIIRPWHGMGSAADSAEAPMQAECKDCDEAVYGEPESSVEAEGAYFSNIDEECCLVRAGTDTFNESVLVLLADDQENRLISPVNLYSALSMLAEITDGQTRAEILDTLGVHDLTHLREINRKVYLENNVQRESLESLTANSVWLSDERQYHEDTLAALMNEYQADVYRGSWDAQFNGMLQKWLNDHTGNLLEDSVSGIRLPEDTLLALASAVYYKASWMAEFRLSEEKEPFHAPEGDEEAQYLRRTDEDSTVYSTERCSAVCLELQEGGSVWIILPDEDETITSLLQKEDILELVRTGGSEVIAERKTGDVHISLPLFDVQCELDLREQMPLLGMTTVLGEDADFSPITDEYMMLSSAKHAARFTVDEEGVSGAAYTIMVFDTAMAQPEEAKQLYFTADRPFLFLVTAEDGALMFAGTVNHPGE